MSRIYVTGASGMIGAELLSRGGSAEMIAVSRNDVPSAARGLASVRRVRAYEDMGWLSPDDLDATIIHLAGLSRPRKTFPGFADLARQHVLPHIDMVERLLECGWHGRLIFSSSAAIYGNVARLPISEDAPANPANAYGVSKLCLERGLARLARQRGFSLVVLRIANVYGSRFERSDDRPVMSILRDVSRSGETFKINGDGSATRDYVHIKDLCAAFELSRTTELAEPVSILNIGGGQGVSLNALVSAFADALGRPIPVSHGPEAAEARSSVLDNARAAALLGWRPEVSVDEGVQDLLNAFR